MHAQGDGIGLLLLLADDEHGVDARFFGAKNAALELVVAEFQIRTHHLAAEFLDDALGIIKLLFCNRQHTDLLRRKPEREIACIMFDEESDEPLVGSERRAMDAERGLLGIIAVLIYQEDPA